MVDENAPRKTRIVLCMGRNCNRDGQADPFYERMVQVLGYPGPAWMARGPVTWETATCLSMCDHGPNLVIYPEQRCIHHLDSAALEQVIEEQAAE